MEKLKINHPVIVEGKYDKIKLSGIIEANIFTTDGFGIFNEKEKNALIKRISEKSKIIVFTDSDGAGLVIRNHFSAVIGKDKIINIYTPQIKGKEKRKAHSSKEGFLGVEGQDTELLRSLFLPFSDKCSPKICGGVTKLDMYNDGLYGKDDSSAKRDALSKVLSLPCGMSTGALLEAINLLYTYDEYKEYLKNIL